MKTGFALMKTLAARADAERSIEKAAFRLLFSWQRRAKSTETKLRKVKCTVCICYRIMLINEDASLMKTLTLLVNEDVRFAHGEMNSVLHPAQRDFTAQRFHPPQADFTRPQGRISLKNP